MATDKFSRDLAISRKKTIKPKKSFDLSGKWNVTKAVTREYAATTLVIVYVVNGLLASAILFDIVSAPEVVRHAVAALAIAYSAVGFVMFINRGVKHQLAERKLNKED